MKVVVIPGDGIGPEVITQATRVLKAVVPGVELAEYPLGARRYVETGELLTREDLARLQDCDALLLGAIGSPEVKPGVLERGILLALRFAFDHHINLRPARTYPGVLTPLTHNPEVDIVVVREGTEGPYIGNGGVLRPHTAHEVATEVSVNTRFGVERVVRYAFAKAQARRKRLTLVHKTNVLAYAGDLWQRTLTEVGAQFPEVTTDYLHVDAATMQLVSHPERFDVVVTDNLFGDIITDLAAAVTGGIGLAASGNIDSSGVFPAMFEPVHGSAPDIAGRNVADPIAAISSVALLLEHTGYAAGAQRVVGALSGELASREARVFSTTEVGDRVLSLL